ncbi:MFS transporter [Kibdelosporangium lantanae]
MTSYRRLFAVREFRYLYLAQTLSHVGDQLAGVAVAVLVFDTTASELLAALGYASSYLPGVLGGQVLAAYADRLPRRRVMILCDLVRAVAIAVVAIPGLPVAVAIALLFCGQLFASPFTAARAATIPQVLEGEDYIAGNGLGNITFQVSQIAGFAVGGVVVALIHPTGALIADSATFVLSAVLLWIGVHERPAPGDPERPSLLRDTAEGLRYVFGDRWLRGCLLLVWLSGGFAYAPESIAYPYAEQLGGEARTAGLLLAAPCFGYVVGALLLTRIVSPGTRDRLLLPMAVLSTAALVPVLLDPPLVVVLGLYVVTGFGASFSAPLNAVFVRRVADAYRGRAMGVAVAGIMASQGLGFLLAGAVAQLGPTPSTVAGLAGVAGTGCLVVIGVRSPVGRAAVAVAARP